MKQPDDRAQRELEAFARRLQERIRQRYEAMIRALRKRAVEEGKKP